MSNYFYIHVSNCSRCPYCIKVASYSHGAPDLSYNVSCKKNDTIVLALDVKEIPDTIPILDSCPLLDKPRMMWRYAFAETEAEALQKLCRYYKRDISDRVNIWKYEEDMSYLKDNTDVLECY